MSRKTVFLFVVVAILAALCSACGDECDNCVPDNGKQVVFDKSSGSFVEPTPSPVKKVESFVQQTVKDTSLTFDKEVDRIGLGNTNERINAWTAQCLAKGPGYHTRQIDVVTVICEKP